jgi:CHAT domain-containing protein
MAPHGDLHYLPFAALHRSGAAPSFLVERYAIAMVPSASVWLRLRQRAPDVQPARVLALAPRVDALPGSRAEVTRSAGFLGRARGC